MGYRGQRCCRLWDMPPLALLRECVVKIWDGASMYACGNECDLFSLFLFATNYAGPFFLISGTHFVK